MLGATGRVKCAVHCRECMAHEVSHGKQSRELGVYARKSYDVMLGLQVLGNGLGDWMGSRDSTFLAWSRTTHFDSI